MAYEATVIPFEQENPLTAPPPGAATLDASSQMRLIERMKEIVNRLSSEAQRRVGLRQMLEQRWIEDLEQYNGLYDATTQTNLNDGEKSKLFINYTQSKTDAMSARLIDLLFPTDDKNWAIRPTPVPEMGEAASAALQKQLEMDKALKEQAAAGEPVTDEQLKEKGELDAYVDNLQGIISEAKKRAEAMEREIDDQLTESHYNAAMRDVIEDACKLGTGVCKGPITGDKIRKGWKKRQMQDGTPVDGYELQIASGNQPAMRYVDIWSFFPDMDARKVEEGQGNMERHLMTPKMLRDFARLSGVDKNACRRLLLQKPNEVAPTYLASLRNITDSQQQIGSNFYHVWEYSGPLEPEEMRDVAFAMGDMATVQELASLDLLLEVHAVIYFCQGELLRFTIYPLDSNECMYSVFNLAKEEASIFGKGVPALIRDPQSMLNAGVRAMMDNAGLATGPQVVIDSTLIEPQDGKWELTPRKIWRAKKSIPRETQAFDSFNVDMHQTELTNIISLAKQFIDDMAFMPQIAQGELGALPKTLPVGTTILAMNSANVVFRRIVKNFDDDVTTPNIRRFYDWNMQHSTKQAIKGDYCIDALGSSVLLVREMQAQNLMIIASQFGQHPVYGPMLKNREVLRLLFKAHMIPADEVVLTDDEIDAAIAAGEEAANAQKEAADAELNLKVQVANIEAGTRVKVAEIQRETAMMEMAARMNMSLDQIEAKLQDQREARQSKERALAVETAMAAKTGKSAGGSV